MRKWRWLNLLRQVHEDEKGVVSLETVLIIGAIALPVLIFLVKVVWPYIQRHWEAGTRSLDEGIDQIPQQ